MKGDERAARHGPSLLSQPFLISSRQPSTIQPTITWRHHIPFSVKRLFLVTSTLIRAIEHKHSRKTITPRTNKLKLPRAYLPAESSFMNHFRYTVVYKSLSSALCIRYWSLHFQLCISIFFRSQNNLIAQRTVAISVCSLARKIPQFHN